MKTKLKSATKQKIARNKKWPANSLMTIIRKIDITSWFNGACNTAGMI